MRHEKKQRILRIAESIMDEAVGDPSGSSTLMAQRVGNCFTGKKCFPMKTGHDALRPHAHGLKKRVPFSY
jgi:hypothetical protein